MKKIPVDSSMLQSAGYDAEAKIFEVEFHNGNVYQYLEVPETIYQEFLEAESKGRYMKNCVIDCYDYTRKK